MLQFIDVLRFFRSVYDKICASLTIEMGRNVMNSTQPILTKAKKTLKFVWRHFFTLAELYFALNAILFRKPFWMNIFLILCAAIIIDWAKQFIKFSPRSTPYSDPHKAHPYNDITVPLHIRQWWNPGLIGTASYESDNYPRMKYD
jgi:hypothetical protein